MKKQPYDPIGTVADRYKRALDNQRTKFTKFNDFDYIFHSKLKKSDPNVPSKVFNPIIWSFIETVMSRMLAKKPVIAFKPREQSDNDQSKLMTELFSYWFDKAGAYAIISDFIKQALIYGTAIVKIDWYTSKPRVVKSYITDPITGEAMFDPMTNNYMTNETEVTDYDDPRIQNVNIYDFFVDPNATDINDASWVIHQYYTTVEELERNEKYKSSAISQLKDLTSANSDSEGESFEQQRKVASGYSDFSSRGKDRVKIWEMWENNKVCVIANEDILLFEGDNPFWHGYKPFVRYIDSSNTLEFYGKGEIEPVEKLIHWLNTNINQRVVNINQILAPVWKARVNVDESELQFIPNTVIHVNDMEDVEFLRQNDVTASSFQEQSVIIETIQRALGVTDYVQGVQTPGQTKAEVEIKTAQANSRFSTKITSFEETALKQIGELVYKLYQQYVTTDKVLRIVGTDGERFVRLTPHDLTGEYDVIPESGSTLETDQEEGFKKFFNLATYLQTKPYINQLEIDKELVTRSGEKDVEKFFSQGAMNGQSIGQLPGLGAQGTPTTPGLPQNNLGVGQVL